MELKSIKPAHGGFAHGGYVLKYFVLSDAFVVAGTQWRGINKGYPCALSQTAGLHVRVNGSMLYCISSTK